MPEEATYAVRFTLPALNDLRSLARRDPQIVRAVLAKVQLLKRDPYAGRPLAGNLIGWRKLVVGDRHWRVVWRVVKEADGTSAVEVSEIWGVGARSESAIYSELERRIADMPEGPETQALAQVTALMTGSRGTREYDNPAEPVPDWLVARLTEKAGLRADQVQAMSLEEAVDAWTDWTSRRRG